MEGRPAGLRRLHLEAKFRQIEPVHERIDGPDRIILVNPFVEALRQERQLLAIHPGNKPFHEAPRANRRENHNMSRRFHAARVGADLLFQKRPVRLACSTDVGCARFSLILSERDAHGFA